MHGFLLADCNGKLWLQIFQLKVDGVALRLIPEASQIQNAVMVRERCFTHLIFGGLLYFFFYISFLLLFIEQLIYSLHVNSWN